MGTVGFLCVEISHLPQVGKILFVFSTVPMEKQAISTVPVSNQVAGCSSRDDLIILLGGE